MKNKKLRISAIASLLILTIASSTISVNAWDTFFEFDEFDSADEFTGVFSFDDTETYYEMDAYYEETTEYYEETYYEETYYEEYYEDWRDYYYYDDYAYCDGHHHYHNCGHYHPSGAIYTVGYPKHYLALRTAPAYDYYNEIGKLYHGDTVEVINYGNGTYWYVYSPKYGCYGYVNHNYLY